MPRKPRQLSETILSSLDQRPKIRYVITKKGTKAFSRGETFHEKELESLLEATEANNNQPISLKTWREFHKPETIRNQALRELVRNQIVSIVSRSKGAFAKS